MNMRMKSSGFAEGLNDGDHARTKALFFESGGAHELLDGLVSASGELAEKLAVVEEVGSEHFGNRENPHRVRDVLEDFVIQERRKGCGSLRVTRGTDVSLTTGEHDQPLGTAVVASKPGEATFRRSTVEVTSDDGIGETSLPAVGVLEAVLPHRLDVVVVGLDQLK
jgi:hypothetical protein